MAGLNATQVAVLGLLRDGPATSGEIFSRASVRLGGVWSLTRSQVFKELNSLRRVGFVDMRRVAGNRKFWISFSGGRALDGWLLSDRSSEVFRLPFVLHAAFGSPAGLAAAGGLSADQARVRAAVAARMAVASREFFAEEVARRALILDEWLQELDGTDVSDLSLMSFRQLEVNLQRTIIEWIYDSGLLGGVSDGDS